MKKIISTALTVCMLYGIAPAAFAAETIGGQITLTQLLGAGRESVVSVRLDAAGNTAAPAVSEFYDLADSMMLTSSLSPEQAEFDGVFITAETNGGEFLYAYVSASGGADRYSAMMSRYPYAIYTVNDSSQLHALLQMAGITVPSIYTDGPGTVSEWAKDPVNKAYAAGLIPSDLEVSDLTAPITREQFCELALCTLAKDGAETIDASSDVSAFSDTDNASVNILHSLGIINGRNETEFMPDERITREEAAAILYRMAGYMELESTGNSTVYSDMEKVSDYAKEAVAAVTELGIMNGMSETEFAPKECYTSEQAVITMLRLYEAAAR